MGNMQSQRRIPDAPLAFDPTDPAFVADPYPRYAEIRESEVVHVGLEGTPVLTRHADVVAVLRDTRFSSDPSHRPEGRRPFGGVTMPVQPGSLPVMLFKDPPDHTRLRRLANAAFTPRAVEALRPRIREIVEGLCDRAADAGRMEVMAELAFPLPVTVICEMLGVPVVDHERFRRWSTDATRVLDPVEDPGTMQRAFAAVLELIAYFTELIAERRSRPGDDLLSALIAAEEAGDRLSAPELMAMVLLLFLAGHETTTNLIGNGILALARHPDQWRRLREDPGLVPGAVEELLRFDPPVQVTARTATCDTEVNGIGIRAGELVVCALAAANRDPRVFPDPDTLRIDRREARQHLSFGNGIHYCLGAPLARVEAQEVFGALVRRFGSVELDTDEPRYREHFVLRGLAELPVTLTGARPRPSA